jgi:hypothetical protein
VTFIFAKSPFVGVVAHEYSSGIRDIDRRHPHVKSLLLQNSIYTEARPTKLFDRSNLSLDRWNNFGGHASGHDEYSYLDPYPNQPFYLSRTGSTPAPLVPRGRFDHNHDGEGKARVKRVKDRPLREDLSRMQVVRGKRDLAAATGLNA